MITKKEFYFIRHGQTDANIHSSKADHPDPPLNQTGRRQVQEIEPLIASLKIDAICYSPLIRARETVELISSKITVDKWEIPHLEECSFTIWQEMTALGAKAYSCGSPAVREFMQRVISGVNQALECPGNLLVVAHGGIYWAICCLIALNEEWLIDNCVPVQLTHDRGCWGARKLV